MHTHIIVGCGGVGSNLAQILVKLCADDIIHLFDGDTVEEKNLDRQFFSDDDIGCNKAEALAQRIGLSEYCECYFSEGSIREFDLRGREPIILWCCADNNAARRACLRVADRGDAEEVIIGANEYVQAEAYLYQPVWEGGPRDPRTFYTQINTDDTGNPLGPQGCTGEAQVASPQLILANTMAANMMLSLYYFWHHHSVSEGLPADTMDEWPIHLKWNPFRFQTIKRGERK